MYTNPTKTPTRQWAKGNQKLNFSITKQTKRQLQHNYLWSPNY